MHGSFEHEPVAEYKYNTKDKLYRRDDNVRDERAKPRSKNNYRSARKLKQQARQDVST